MRNVLITLGFFALFLISCSDNGGGVEPEPGFEPYYIGSFKVVSPTEAEFVGSNQKGKSLGDTLDITNPDNMSLTITRDSTDDLNINGDLYAAFDVRFEDSTYTEADSLSLTLSSIEFPSGGDYINLYGGGYGFGPDWIEARSYLRFNCNYDQVKTVDYLVHLVGKDSSHVQSYDFEVNNMVDVFDDLGCN